MKDNYMIYIVVALVVLVGGFVLFQNMAPQDSDMAVTTDTMEVVDTDEMALDNQMDDDAMAAELSNIVEIAASDENFSTLVTAVVAANLQDTLAQDGPYTVFAPIDEAFAALPAGTLDALLADPEALVNVLTYHVVPGYITSEQVVTFDTATALNEQDITITTDADGNVMVNDANIIIADIEASNGIIHVIDNVLLPQ